MHGFNWFHWLFEKVGIEITHHNVHMVTAGFVTFLLVITSLFVAKHYRKPEARIVPGKKFSLFNFFELISEGILGLMEGIMGERAGRYFPLIGTLFVYIFVSNILGLIPGMLPPTDNINTNVACALVVFLYYNYLGVKEQGAGPYFKHLLGPVLWLGPLMLVVELIGHIFRPISLSIRLFGNMTGDHLVLSIFSDLIPLFVPVIFMLLGLFVSFIQAFVFSLLSMIYISLATEVEHH